MFPLIGAALELLQKPQQQDAARKQQLMNISMAQMGGAPGGAATPPPPQQAPSGGILGTAAGLLGNMPGSKPKDEQLGDYNQSLDKGFMSSPVFQKALEDEQNA